MALKPIDIGPRKYPHHYPNGHGGGQADHTRYINGRPFYFEWFWESGGEWLITVRTLVPNPGSVPDPKWHTVHEISSYQAA